MARKRSRIECLKLPFVVTMTMAAGACGGTVTTRDGNGNRTGDGSGGQGGGVGDNTATGGKRPDTGPWISSGGSASSEGDAASPSGPNKVYRLVQTRNVGSPLPDPTGVASDGNRLWILNGGQNSFANTLIHFDPSTGVTDRSFQLGLIEMLGSGAYGITWDGAAVWISVSGNTNKLAVVDPKTGMITKTWSSPTDLGPSDLDFDGTRLWLSSGTGTAFVIDPSTGGIERHFGIGVTSAGRDNGIALRAGEVWVGGLFGGIEIYDPATGSLTARAVHSDGSAFMQEEEGSSCFIGDELVIASKFGISYFQPTLVAP